MSSRLPETELANWSFLSPANKRKALELHIRPKQIVGTYEPFRTILSDAVNTQLPLFREEETASTPWVEIDRQIRRRCRKSDDILKMNLDIAKATHTYAEENKLTAVPIDVTSLAFGVGHLYQFGLPLLMRYPDRVAAVFLDLRRSNGLSINGRAWIFSAMHERFRAAYPDLSAIELEIWRYKNNSTRTIEATRCEILTKSFPELVYDARETYSIYERVLAGDRDEKRRGAGGAGPLFD